MAGNPKSYRAKKMLTEQEKELAKKFGNFYLQKNCGNYTTCQAEITNLQISQFKLLQEQCPTCKGHEYTRLQIVCVRVGLFIGKLGKNIDELENYLGIKIKLEEEKDPLYQYLIPYDYSKYNES